MMENKIKIGIDIDEVIVEFMKHFLDYSNRKNKTSFFIEDIKNYHLWKTPIHVSKEESIKEVIEFQNSSDFEKVDFADGMKEILLNLGKEKSLYFITSRPIDIKEKTIEMLKKNLKGINFEIRFSGEIYGGKSKSEICFENNISLMIEDDACYALDCARKGIKVFLIEKPWNKNYEAHQNITKVKDWNEILNNLNTK